MRRAWTLWRCPPGGGRHAAVGLAAACRTIQLVDARDGGPRSATDAIGATLDGKTQRRKNRHPLHSLAWLEWIVARLGAWNCYYKPPGPKTMRAGRVQFKAMAAEFAFASKSRGESNVRIPYVSRVCGYSASSTLTRSAGGSGNISG